MVTTIDYTERVEELDEETIAERIAILLEAAGIAEPDDEGSGDYSYYHYQRNRAYEIAAQFPSQISDDLFAEYVAEGIVTL